MPWNMKDYPAALKNLEPLVRKKAIEIGNALLHDGYPDDRAIPISIQQAKKWLAAATAEEKKDFEQSPDPQKDDPHEKNKNTEKLMDASVIVEYEGDRWKVISQGAKRASDTFSTKEAAIGRAKEIAKHKLSEIKIYRQDGTLQQTHDYSE